MIQTLCLIEEKISLIKNFVENFKSIRPGTSCSYSSSPSGHSKTWKMPLSAGFDVGIGGRLNKRDESLIIEFRREKRRFSPTFHVIRHCKHGLDRVEHEDFDISIHKQTSSDRFEAYI